jgi:hypothetical protein
MDQLGPEVDGFDRFRLGQLGSGVDGFFSVDSLLCQLGCDVDGISVHVLLDRCGSDAGGFSIVFVWTDSALMSTVSGSVSVGLARI